MGLNNSSSIHFPIHIIFITPGFPADEKDSVCIPPLQAYLLALRKAHPEVHVRVLALTYPHQQRQYKWHEIEVSALNGRRFKRWRKPWLWRMVQNQLKHWQRQEKIDVIHSLWLTDTTLLVQQFCKKHGVKHVATIMGQDALPANLYLRHLDFSRVVTVGLSQHAVRAFTQTTGKEVSAIVPWGIDEQQIGQYKSSMGKDWDIIAVSSMVAVKQPHVFIKAISEIYKRHPDLKVMLIGIGPQLEEVQHQVQENGLKEVISMPGELPREEVLQLMARSKVLLHTAAYEGQGYVFLEALALGVPVVTFDVGFLPKHELVHICRSEVEMAQAVEQVFAQRVNVSHFVPVTIQDTVHGYWQQYV